MAPARYVRKAGGGNSCCSPGCCPSYVSVMCLCRSTVVGCHVICLLCENRNGGGESLTTIGAVTTIVITVWTTWHVCCRATSSSTCAFEAACVDEMVMSHCHVVMVESEESAALNNERGCNEKWGYIQGELQNKFGGGFNDGIQQSRRRAVSRS
jgi:hypothetical protein